MKKIRLIIIIFAFLMLLFMLTGCENKNDEEIIKEKSLAEMEFLENEILTISKGYINGDYIEKEIMNWKKVSTDFKTISDAIDVIIIDLSSLEIDNDKIMSLQTMVNDVSYAIQRKSEGELLVTLSNLYSLVPTYTSLFNSDAILIKTKTIKSNLLTSVASSFIDDYEIANNCINEAEKVYNELLQNETYLRDNSYKANRNFVKIEQLKISIQDKNIDSIFETYLDTLNMFD